MPDKHTLTPISAPGGAGDPIEDLIVCPGCRAINTGNDILAKVEASDA